jgi:prephenate dehydrogenase
MTETSTTDITTIGIVGLGLIGGSIARLIKEKRPHGHVKGFDHNTRAKAEASQSPYFDSICESLDQLCNNADLLIVATPIDTVVDIILKLDRLAERHAIITDVASVKATVVSQLSTHTLQHTVIPGHPMGGSEKSGLQHASASYLYHVPYLITPLPTIPVPAHFNSFLESLSFQVTEMDAVTHDQLLALTSHMPYLVSTLLTSLFKSKTGHSKLPYTLGPGARDATRLSQSSPHWGRDVMQHNRESLIQLLYAFRSQTDHILATLENNDWAALESHFRTAQKIREDLANGFPN